MPSNLISITGRIEEIAEPILDEMGYELVNVEYLSKNGKWVLRIFIDKEGGVTIDDCARVSNELGDLIDVKDVIEHEYIFEVSSPGLNRPLKKEKDFLVSIGKKIKIKTSSPISDRRNFSGRLIRFQDNTIFLDTEKGPIEIQRSKIEKANLIYEFKN